MTGNCEALTVLKDNMGNLKDELQKSMTQMKEFDKLKDQVKMTITQKGLRVELLETESGTFFNFGRSHPTAKGQELWDVLAEELGKLPRFPTRDTPTSNQMSEIMTMETGALVRSDAIVCVSPGENKPNTAGGEKRALSQGVHP
jgi:hypothetical protein